MRETPQYVINAYRIRYFLEHYEQEEENLWSGDVQDLADVLNLSVSQVTTALHFARTKAREPRDGEPGWTIPSLKKGGYSRRLWQVVVLDGSGNGNLSNFYLRSQSKLLESRTHLELAHDALESLTAHARLNRPGMSTVAGRLEHAAAGASMLINAFLAEAEKLQISLETESALYNEALAP